MINYISERQLEMDILKEENFGPGHHSIQSNLGHLPEGLYFVRFKAGDDIITKKIIKTK